MREGREPMRHYIRDLSGSMAPRIDEGTDRLRALLANRTSGAHVHFRTATEQNFDLFMLGVAAVAFVAFLIYLKWGKRGHRNIQLRKWKGKQPKHKKRSK
jgi:hypothetical protein